MARSTIQFGSVPAASSAVTRAASTALLFDHSPVVMMGDYHQSGPANFSLMPGANKPGVSINMRFHSDGSPIHFMGEFDSLAGVDNGGALPLGRHDFWFVYDDMGKISLAVRSNTGSGYTHEGISNLSAVTINSNRIDLNWTNPDNNAGIKVFRKLQNALDSTYVQVAALSAGTTYYAGPGLSAQTAYTFKVVRAINTAESIAATINQSTV